jgi:hypothetical protein
MKSPGQRGPGLSFVRVMRGGTPALSIQAEDTAGININLCCPLFPWSVTELAQATL